MHQAIPKFQKYGIYTDRKRSGRPLKTSSRNDHIIEKIAVQSPLSSSKKIRKELLQAGVNISRSTVSRRLNMNFGLKACKPARKPRLTPLMKKKCLSFAKALRSWTGHQRIGARCYFQMNPQCSNFLFGCNMFGDHLENDIMKRILFQL